jgi:hypothetical protein
MNKIEILVCRWLIGRIRKGFGADCKGYMPECVSCRAKECIEFLEEFIELNKDYD